MRKERRGEERTLNAVAKQFDYWRRHRKKRGPTPAALLAGVEALQKRIPIGVLAKTLHFNPTDIKRRIAESHTERGARRFQRKARKEKSALSFVEMPVEAGSVCPPRQQDGRSVVEFETPLGYKVRFYTPQTPAIEVRELLTTLFRP